MFGNSEDFPETKVTDQYLVFDTKIEDYLGFAVGNNVKALKLYRLVRKEIQTPEQVPDWIPQILAKIENLPTEAESILKE